MTSPAAAEGLSTEARACARTALEALGTKLLKKAAGGTVGDVGAAGRHVMVSYCWDQQAVVKRVHAALVEREYNVWIDIEQMRGSTVESMAAAVENAEFVLIGVSRQYKESTNCRLEAQYAMQREVPTIPLMLFDGYRADGWLGMLMGTRMWYAFFGAVLEDDALFDRKVLELCRELGDPRRGGAESDAAAAAAPRTVPAAVADEREADTAVRRAPAAAAAEGPGTPRQHESDFTPSIRRRVLPSPVPRDLEADDGDVMALRGSSSFAMAPAGAATPLSEGFYLQLERERAERERERERAERERSAERERAAERSEVRLAVVLVVASAAAVAVSLATLLAVRRRAA